MIIPRSMPADQLARATGLHPELVRALVRSGFVGLDESPARLARAMRLRRDLGVNLAGALLACDLLERIEELETKWTPTN
jgi:chaperone modulatory protein CbpM